MKILQINIKYKIGGAGKIVYNLHNELKQQSIESFVMYGRDYVSNDNYVIKIASEIEVKLDAFISRIFGLNGYTNFFSTNKAKKMINKINPDIIHLHGVHGYYLNYIKLFKFLSKKDIPIVWTFHDTFAFTGKCAYPYTCEKWKTQCEKCPLIKEYPKSLGVDFTRKMYIDKKKAFTKINKMTIVSPSEWMTSLAEKSFLGKYKCITIHNGIDTEGVFYKRENSITREKYGYTFKDKIILGIADGITEYRKGVSYLIQLAKDLSEFSNIKIILIGWKDKVDPLIKQRENIRIVPFTKNQDELADYYSISDVFVIPSLAENYATVVLESFACGTPVVGFDVGGIPKQVENGLGLVVPAGDQSALNDAVLEVLNKKSSLLDSDQIIEITKSKNSLKTMTEAYIDLYKSLILK
ncbi:hypothetical protein BK011_02375 [Tenericutes bacterium MZ-XQ]|nr:hypothetical protein BK011_02375 [Tenericutes bacterium MZ-XQ]